MAENQRRWRIRGTLIIVGILTLVICTILLIYYTCLLFHDLSNLKLGNPIWEEAGSKGPLMTSLLKAIDVGLEDICDFKIMTPRSTTSTANSTRPAKKKEKKKREMKWEMKREIHKGTTQRVRTAAWYHPEERKKTNGIPLLQRNRNVKKIDFFFPTTKSTDYMNHTIVRNPKESIPEALKKTQPSKPPEQPSTKKNATRGKEKITDQFAPTEASNHTHPPHPVRADQDLCMIVVEEERQKLKDALYRDRFNVYSRLERHIHNIFIALDIILMILCALGIIAGYILIVGALRKRHHLLLPWLLITFTVAYGAMTYMICHYYMEHRPKSTSHFGIPLTDMRSVQGNWDPTIIAIMALVFLIVIALHAAGFYAVTKYYYHLREKRDSRPEAPIRRMRLVLSRRVD